MVSTKFQKCTHGLKYKHLELYSNCDIYHLYVYFITMGGQYLKISRVKSVKNVLLCEFQIIQHDRGSLRTRTAYVGTSEPFFFSPLTSTQFFFLLQFFLFTSITIKDLSNKNQNTLIPYYKSNVYYL